MKSACASTSHRTSPILNQANSRLVLFRPASTRLPPSSFDARGPAHGLPHLVVQLLELFAVANRIRRLRRAKHQDPLRQAGAISQEALACSLDSGQRALLRRFEPPAPAHHRAQQRRTALESLSVKTNDIPREFFLCSDKPENLLPSRVGYLFLAELGGASNGVAEVDFDEFINY